MRKKTFDAVVFLACLTVCSSVVLDAGQGGQRRPTEPDLFDDIAAASFGAFIGEGLSQAAQDFATMKQRFAEASQEIAAGEKGILGTIPHWTEAGRGRSRVRSEALTQRRRHADDGLDRRSLQRRGPQRTDRGDRQAPAVGRQPDRRWHSRRSSIHILSLGGYRPRQEDCYFGCHTVTRIRDLSS